ncbi:MAG: tetratricopeptide repeat protein [Anaerolineae bacterium]
MADKKIVAELTPSQAIEQYQRAVEMEPNSADKYMELGAAYYIAHRWDDAIQAFEKAAQLQPDLGHVHYYLGVLYAAKGDKARAQKELDAVIKVSKNPILIAQAKARIPAVTGPAQLARS